jgi:hypothetical protein
MKTMMNTTRKRVDTRRTSGNAGKKLFIILFSLGLAVGASAQRGIGHGYVGGGFHGGYHPHYAPRVYYAPSYYGGWGWGLGFGLGWGMPGWYGPWGYPYGYPAYYYGRGPIPEALQVQIDGIKSDYKAQIKDVKHDKALSHSDRKEKINSLEQQRDAAITQARHDFYNRQMRNSKGSSANDPDHPEYSDKGSTNGGQK